MVEVVERARALELSEYGFDFELARADEAETDRALRRLLAVTPVPGRVALSFEREPSFFAGCQTLGTTCQVIVGRQRSTGQIAGLACRATRWLHVNGAPRRLGYLGQLRVDRAFRGQSLLLRGFRFLRQLHDADPVEAYLATITDENRQARGLLVEHPRGHFPTFREVTRVSTLALFVRGTGSAADRARPEELPAIIRFLNEHGPRRQFFPVYREADFTAGSLTTAGFNPKDFVVVRGRQGAIQGLMGVWDQSAYKQTVVRGYDAHLGRLRPVVNLAARAAGMRRAPLPPPGEHLSNVYASFVCLASDDPTIFQRLLRQAMALAAQRRANYLTIGLTEGDPLLRIARRYPHLSYHSRLYLAAWDGCALYNHLDATRVPYVEIAAL